MKVKGLKLRSVSRGQEFGPRAIAVCIPRVRESVGCTFYLFIRAPERASKD